MRRCKECKDGIICTLCKNQVNENKEFEAKLSLIKRQAPNESGQMRLHFG